MRRRVVLWLVDIENTPHMRNIEDRPPKRHVYAKPITVHRTDSTEGTLAKSRSFGAETRFQALRQKSGTLLYS